MPADCALQPPAFVFRHGPHPATHRQWLATTPAGWYNPPICKHDFTLCAATTHSAARWYFMTSNRFPLGLFGLFTVFFSSQALIGSYMNLYLDSTGLTKSEIGLTVSISTACLLLLQPIWGLLSDKARNKNRLLMLLLALAAGAALLIPQLTGLWMLVGGVCLVTVFYNPIQPLLENLALENLEGSRWDYGQIRMGGTFGFSVMVLVAGVLLQNNYRMVFPAVAVILLTCAAMIFRLPPVRGHRHGENRAPVRDVFRDPILRSLVLYFLLFVLTANVFYSFYPIHFASIGGNSAWVGLLLFVCAISEVPFFFFAGALVKRLGLYRMILLSGLATALRWFLIFSFSHPVPIVLAGLLHGVGFVPIGYGVAIHINKHLPKELRATAQSLVALLTAFFSRVVFGYAGGVACDAFGIRNVLLIASGVMLLATALFAVGYQRALRKDPHALDAVTASTSPSPSPVPGRENKTGTLQHADSPSAILDVSGPNQGG